MQNEALSWWNLLPSHMDPTLITIGSFPLRWYGLMYLAAFYTCYQVIWRTIKTDRLNVSREQLDGLATWVIAGILIGGRLGYVVFYNFNYYIQHPFEAILPFSFEGGFHFTGISGMSYHGGLIGGAFAGSWFVIKSKLNYWMMNNLVMYSVPLGYTWGRMGNFINGELWGRPTDAAIGMVFPMDKLQQMRHPSQLYEAFFEGVVLFGILYLLRKLKNTRDHMMASYLMGYGAFRFVIEYFREPDAHIGLNAMGLSRGQILCVAMVIGGLVLWIWRLRSVPTPQDVPDVKARPKK